MATFARKKKDVWNRTVSVLIGLVALELVVFVFLLFSAILPYTHFVIAVVGSPNVTVQTLLTVGNVFPEILNVSAHHGAATLDLTANSTALVLINITARDFNGEGDIRNVSVEFFDMVNSSYGGLNDNNNHYSNTTCVINFTYGDTYEISALCSIPVWYYANNATWNATVLVIDNESLNTTGGDTIMINTLLALALPDTIDYGTVNATAVSLQRTANVTNAGNVPFNLSLSGYGYQSGDGNAMNCTLGSIKNISIGYEKYNLTVSNTSVLTSLSQFESIYKNLSAAVVVNRFNLLQRYNDTAAYIDDTNSTYWRIYVPLGVAGSCQGNVVFGAVQATGV